MGTCQSQLNSEDEFVPPYSLPNTIPKSSPRKFSFGEKEPIAFSSSIPKNGVRTKLISPTERTEATEVDSPYAFPLSPFTPESTDEFMDIDDTSSAAEEESLSEQSGYFATHDPENLLLGDEGVDDDDGEYLLSNEPISSSPFRMVNPKGFEPHSQHPSGSVKKRLQTVSTRSSSHGPDRLVSPSPLLAPPKHVVVAFDSVSTSTVTSVNPQIVAHFHRLKIQAELATKLEKKRRLKKKIKERRVDIQGYKNLWEEYSGIKDKALQSQHDQNETKKRLPWGETRCISLNDSTTWFVVSCTFVDATFMTPGIE
jgi:hypothetical protein